MFRTAIAGSLPKPAWLAETHKLWPQWRSQGDELADAKRDATLLWIKAQEDAGLAVIGDGEQSRQHFVHGFLERVAGIDFEHKVEMGIRADRYKAMVPQVTGPLSLKGRVHETEARLLRAHTTRLTKFTLPGPMTIVDTVADRHYGDRVKMAFAFAELLNQEARALQADGIDIVQFDEPAFNVFLDEAADWGVKALERAAQGLGSSSATGGRACKTAVHICYGYGIEANLQWKATLGEQWRQYEKVFPALAKSRIDQVSLECLHSHVPIELIALLEGKEVMVGVIDVASDTIETPEEVADTIGRALKFVHRDRLIACTNCGLAPMDRHVAEAKLRALAAGAALAGQRLGIVNGELMLPPPTVEAGTVDAALRERGHAVLDAAGLHASLGVSPGALDAWPRYWDRLPPDAHLRDGGRYRQRRHGSFVLDGDDLRAMSHRAHWQPVEYNALHGGIERWFEPLEAALLAEPLWPRLLRWLGGRASAMRGAQPWFVEAHPFRIDTEGGIGRPTPEGAHRDGVDLVAVLLVARDGVKGGETRIFDAAGPTGMRFTMSEPWTTLLLDDARVIHETTPIQPLEAAPSSHRDTLVITLRAGSFQGPAGA